MIPSHNFLGQLKDLVRSLWVQRRCVLIQQKELRLIQGCHQKSQSLPLSTREKPYFAGQAVFQAQAQGGQLRPEEIPLLAGNTWAESTGFAPAVGQRQVFLNAHGGCGSHHRVLEHPAQIFGPFVLGKPRNVHAIQADGSAICGKDPGNEVQGGGFSRAVATDYRDKVSLFQGEVQAVNGPLFVDGASVENLVKSVEFKHGGHPPFFPAGTALGLLRKYRFFQ